MFPPRLLSSLASGRAARPAAAAAAAAGVILTFVNVYQLRAMQAQLMQLLPGGDNGGGLASSAAGGGGMELARPKYVVYGKNIDSGYLKHVYRVLERAGYVR